MDVGGFQYRHRGAGTVGQGGGVRGLRGAAGEQGGGEQGEGGVANGHERIDQARETG